MSPFFFLIFQKIQRAQIMDFFISEDNRASYGVEFPVSKETPIQLGVITAITFAPRVNSKFQLLDGIRLEKGEQPTPEQVTAESIRGTIQIEFASPDGHYSHIEEKWDNSNISDAAMRSRMISMLNTQLLHIAAQVSEDEAGIRAALGNKEAFFAFVNEKHQDEKYGLQWRYLEYIAHVMNTYNGGSPIWKEAGSDNAKRLRFKLTRIPSGKSINKLQLGNGNVVEVIREGVRTILQVSAKDHFDFIEVPASTAIAGGAATPPPVATEAKNPWPTDI